MKMHFGSSRQPVKLIIDMSSAQTLVTSDLCTKCSTKSYIPAKSTSVKDLGSQWDLKYPELHMRFKTIAYRDDVCMSHKGDLLCAKKYTFYNIYKQRGMKRWMGGIAGLGPVPAGSPDRSDSFVYTMAQEEEIQKPMVSIYISNNTNETSNIMFGDYNTSFIAGGDDKAIDWFELSNKTDFQVDVSWAHFGDKQLFVHDYRKLSVNLAVPYIGVDDETWAMVSHHLQQIDSSIKCDSRHCYGTKSVKHYKTTVPDFSIKVASKVVYTMPGKTLMDPAGRNSTYTCKFALFNAKWHFVLGEYFIRNHYTIYDLENMRIGIAPLKNFAYHKNVKHEEAAKVDIAPPIKIVVPVVPVPVN